ncbi:hypothetical protein EMMF5_000709 [Cystobasidiomycetes sp. EMM_F5]
MGPTGAESLEITATHIAEHLHSSNATAHNTLLSQLLLQVMPSDLFARVVDNLSGSFWNDASPDVCVAVWRFCRSNKALADRIAHNLTTQSDTFNQNPSFPRMSDLHSYLYNNAMSGMPNSGHRFRMLGPAPQDMQAFCAYKYLLSRIVLSVKDVANVDVKYAETAADIITQMKQYRMPPDRQVIASVLHMLQLCKESRIRCPQLIHALGPFWQEWTLIREHDPAPAMDDIILVGFLAASDNVTSLPHGTQRTEVPADTTPSPPVDSEAITWPQQALSMAILCSAIQPSISLSRRDRVSIEDQRTTLHPEMLQALACAAVGLARPDVIADCMNDARITPTAALQVLQYLSDMVMERRLRNMDIQKAMIALSAWYIRERQGRIGRGDQHALTAARSVIKMLLYHLRTKEAALIILATPHVHSLGLENLSFYMDILCKDRQPRLAMEIYDRIPPAHRLEIHALPLLRSFHAQTSTAIWKQAMQRMYRTVTSRSLNARIRHYIAYSEAPVKSALADYHQAQVLLQIVPDNDTKLALAKLMLKRGHRRSADEMIRKLSNSGEIPPHIVANARLTASTKPARLHFKKRGMTHILRRFNAELDRVGNNPKVTTDGVTANILVKNSVSWQEMDRETMWQALHAGLVDAPNRRWHRELRVLFKTVYRAFMAKGMQEDGRKVIRMMADMRIERLGR